MNIFKRLFRIGQAEIHAAVEKMEDPIKMTEQGLRELRDDIAQATEAYAKVKALALRTKNEAEKNSKEATDFAEKTVLILQKGEKGELDPDKAAALAKEAIRLKRKFTETADDLTNQAQLHQSQANQMMEQIQILQENLSKWEKELKTIKARIQVSDATKLVNKQLAHIDSDSTIAMLERMKTKVSDQEALAQAYGEITTAKFEVKNEIDKVINNDELSIEMELAAIKKNLGI